MLSPVEGKSDAGGPDRPEIPEDTLKEARALLKKGLSNREISLKTGLSKSKMRRLKGSLLDEIQPARVSREPPRKPSTPRARKNAASNLGASMIVDLGKEDSRSRKRLRFDDHRQDEDGGSESKPIWNQSAETPTTTYEEAPPPRRELLRFWPFLLLLIPLAIVVIIAGNSGTKKKGSKDNSIAFSKVAVERFLEADSIETMLPWTRHPERVASRMRNWYGREFPAPSEDRILFSGSQKLDLFGKSFLRHSVKTDLTGEARDFYVEMGPDGPKVDWETAVNFQLVKTARFQTTRPKNPVPFRAIVREGSRYELGYKEKNRWQCFELTINQTLFYGYVGRDGPLLDEMVMALESSEDGKMILALAYTLDLSTSRQVAIHQIVQNHWVMDYSG
ncbi:MAG: hypothetical protein AAF514_00980 [Verrucomicrobiota bacterium]